jgi:hypothetical protein
MWPNFLLAVRLTFIYTPSSMENPYKQALDAARKELADLATQHTSIEQRIAKLRQTIATLTALSEDPDDEDALVYMPSEVQRTQQHVLAALMGAVGKNMPLSDAVREVLKAGGKPMTPVQVRDGLIRMGIDIEDKYTKALAVIHKALKRLVEKDEVEKGTTPDGRSTYCWKTSLGSLKNLGTDYSRRLRFPSPEKKKD